MTAAVGLVRGDQDRTIDRGQGERGEGAGDQCPPTGPGEDGADAGGQLGVTGTEAAGPDQGHGEVEAGERGGADDGAVEAAGLVAGERGDSEQSENADEGRCPEQLGQPVHGSVDEG